MTHETTGSLRFDLTSKTKMPARKPTHTVPDQSAIEDDNFPFEKFYRVAEHESWRKEIHRPLYHIHKWWARRLGSVFRAIVVGAFSPAGTDVKDSFYRATRFPGAIVFDPFMGSGTTIGEALKLGCRAIGRDINPVAHFAVKNALARHSRHQVIREFRAIEHDVAPSIRHFFRASLPDGSTAQSLYYFWVKVIRCPECNSAVDLFKSYLFARHAYPQRYPAAQAVCPSCGSLNSTRYDATTVACDSCHRVYDPKDGPARGTKAVCPNCQHEFSIAGTVRNGEAPPKHRLYAKLVLTAAGEKQYLPADDFDHALYDEAVAALSAKGGRLPKGELKAGYNTNQAINYGYRHWHQMFNGRQLLCLGMLADRIRSIENEPLRELFTCLLSGTLEFNNMFASYKGEGTGAVRHMFAHHILKPERTPLEANPWGTPKSSGAFSTLFEKRILRALAYCEDPFEIALGDRDGKRPAKKVFGLSRPIGFANAKSFSAFGQGRQLYLSCGDSSQTDLASQSVDAVITDPPFFDNVHYSQLADFFHVWQQHILRPNSRRLPTTRSEREVQHTDAQLFTKRLRSVWQECHRVLKPNGLLVFTYHHARAEGWQSVLQALTGAEFAIVAAHPIKAEMSVAMPKHQSKEPIDLDIIFVCRKRAAVHAEALSYEDAWARALDVAREQISRLREFSKQLSHNDLRVIVTAQVVRFLSAAADTGAASAFLESRSDKLDEAIDALRP
ncbi:MAG: DUF1156 domain-containing protein [Chloroflexi bacterium]|nr:DUF1156 domain-containing protein [Chloroflexota bacterium]